MTLEEDRMMRVTARVIAAYHHKNHVPARLLPQVVESVYGALNNLTAPAALAKQAFAPAVPARKSIGRMT